MKILITLDNPPLVDWLKKKLAAHEVTSGILEEAGSAGMVVCGPSPAVDMEKNMAGIEAFIKETGGAIPIIFVLIEDSGGIKNRLQAMGLPEERIVVPAPGQTVRASELLKAIQRAEEDTAELDDPPVFAGCSPGVEEEISPEKASQVYCISSSKRGCGCTTVAASLAAHGAEAGLKVAFIDLGDPPCAGFHFGISDPALIREPAVHETKWGTLVVPGDETENILEEVISGHDVTVICSPNRLLQLEGSRDVVVLDRDLQSVEITSAQLLNFKNSPAVFVNRSSESSRPDAACIFEQKGYLVITAETDETGCIRALADGKPAITRSPQMAQAIGKLASTLKLLG